MLRGLLSTVAPLSKAVTAGIYNMLNWFGRDVDVVFVNYGYADDHGTQPMQAREHGYHQARLYHHVAKAIDWRGLSALEVGCGRGGGAHYIKRQFGPHSIVGVDLSKLMIEYCWRRYSEDGLSFVRGDAEALPFLDGSFDVVVNVESSFYYPRFERFLGDVARVLKPGGHFLYADMRYANELPRWRREIADAGFDVLEAEDITPNVIRALELDHEQVRALIRCHIPRPLRRPFGLFSGQTGGGLLDGERVYMNYLLRKPPEVAPSELFESPEPLAEGA